MLSLNRLYVVVGCLFSMATVDTWGAERDSKLIAKSHNVKVGPKLTNALKIYNNPLLAPNVSICKGFEYCNVFYAIAGAWQAIPDDFSNGYYDIKKIAKNGDTYSIDKGGLHPCYAVNTDDRNPKKNYKACKIWEAGTISKLDDNTLARGAAVLNYFNSIDNPTSYGIYPAII